MSSSSDHDPEFSPLHPIQSTRMTDCELINHEIASEEISRWVKAGIFSDDFEKSFGEAGSPMQEWYRSVATGKNAVVDEALEATGVFENCRLIAWKTGKPFQPENLFFRTVDSGRLLPMHLADFRVQIYAHRFHMEKLDSTPEGRKGWVAYILRQYLHKILILRNMHDRGGGDIPIIVTAWSPTETDIAMKYWKELSAGEWSEEEEARQYTKCNEQFCLRIRPCFFQVNTLVRALLSDPAAGYVPPFILLHSVLADGKIRAIFTKRLHYPPPSLTQSLPGRCRSEECSMPDCTAIDMDASIWLDDNTPMVRKWDNVFHKRIVCNLWGCEVEYSEQSEVKLQRCQKCREVLYCSRAHQSLDWPVHKSVCESRT